MANHLQFISWARWKVPDPFKPGYFAIFTASILKPSWEFPLPCAAMSIVKGRDKIFFRLSYDLLKQLFIIPEQYICRLDTAYNEALKQANYIQLQQKALHKMSDLSPGHYAVRTDTGEIIAQAERILNEPN